ncbi:hypothetical protein KAFR_0E04340 [Kazachstania africana CBS 2517]|uniref:TATA element modulatory factor 1 TATA binding domain-containing protein n=1 Tax=Kazachstania africana (strain ATCC 22294 / BCRC 22015 / CBS 2517 / CECT 1963 / NBRC 1671 / NRRL Y-8276) TaxID=1071382 RepID=H2AW35_KAZAF|nr:hypothetical protein KAFR_0E04340 [Kazachstania africana CBS 2517]CCF58585.1 hypothetical protein KAFR_0E04340 [Kazachstania africana CBS 2517]
MSSSNKKLSLEERLSLAASKKGKKKSKKPALNAALSSPSPSPLPLDSDAEADHSSQILAETEPHKQEEYELDPFFKQCLPDNFMELDPIRLIELIRPNVEKLNKTQDSSLFRLVKEKDESIQKLEKTNELLSKNEKKSLYTISQLEEKSTKLENEYDILKSADKKNTVKIDQLKKELAALNKINKEGESNFKELTKREEDWKNIETKLESKERTIEELNATIQALEASSKQEKNDHEEKVKRLIESNNEHIISLESSLEQLRIQLSGSESTADDKEGGAINTESYSLLQEQLTSSKKNWESIEFQLNLKMTNLETSLGEKEKLITGLNTEIQNLKVENSRLVTEIEAKKEESKTLRLQFKETSNKTSILEMSLNNLKDDYNLLESKYMIQKSQLENNIKEDHSANEIIKHFENGSHEDWFLQAESSLLSIEEKPQDERKNTVTDDNSNLQIDINEIPDEAATMTQHAYNDDSFMRNSSASLFRKPSTNIQSNSNNIDSGTTQIVTRLGAEIRRLEGELKSIQDRYNNLSHEKSNANEEILRLMNENGQYQSLKEENENLQLRINELNHKLEASLQVLGEKAEQNQELENDVSDLKEMLHLQVQQMVEIQEKISDLK